MKTILLASPYSHRNETARDEQLREAVTMMHALTMRGYNVLCPALSRAAIPELPENVAGWQARDLELVRRVDAVAVNMDARTWRDHPEMRELVHAARIAGVAVYHCGTDIEGEVFVIQRTVGEAAK